MSFAKYLGVASFRMPLRDFFFNLVNGFINIVAVLQTKAKEIKKLILLLFYLLLA